MVVLVGDSLTVVAVALAGKTFGPGVGALSADCLQPMCQFHFLTDRETQNGQTSGSPETRKISA